MQKLPLLGRMASVMQHKGSMQMDLDMCNLKVMDVLLRCPAGQGRRHRVVGVFSKARRLMHQRSTAQGRWLDEALLGLQVQRRHARHEASLKRSPRALRGWLLGEAAGREESSHRPRGQDSPPSALPPPCAQSRATRRNPKQSPSWSEAGPLGEREALHEAVARLLMRVMPCSSCLLPSTRALLEAKMPI